MLLSVLLCRLRDEHALRTKAEAEFKSAHEQLGSAKDQLHDAVARQASDAHLRQELHQEQSLHCDAKSQMAVLQSR